MSVPNGEQGTTTPAGGNDTQSNSGSTSPAGAPNTTPESATQTANGSTFSQADVDRIVQERIARERSKFADYDTLKERAGQWDKFVEEAKPEQEKALDSARQEAEKAAYAKARTEFGGKLVQAHLTAAAAGRLPEGAVLALVAGVDTARFLTDAGDVDTAKVTQFIDGIAPASNGGTPSRPGGFGQGPRDGSPKAGREAGAALWEARHKEGQAPPLFT